jgi:outer membrane protein
MLINRFYFCFMKVILSLVVLALWVPAYATGLTPLIKNALESDPRILLAQADIRASQSDVEGSYSVYYPVIKGTGVYGSVENSNPLQNDGKKSTYGLEIEQPLPFFGGESESIEVFKAELVLKEIEVELVRQDVFFEVLESAITLQQKLSTLRLYELMVDNLFSQVENLRESVAAGGAKMNEYYLAQAEWIQMQVLKAQAHTDHIAALEKLRSLAPDVTVDREFMAADPKALGLPLIPDELGLALSESRSKSPSLLLAVYALEKTQAEFDFAKVIIWPRLSLNYSIERGTFGDTSANTSSVLLNLSVPIFEGFSSTSKMTTAMHRVEAQTQKLHQQRRLHDQRLEEVWLRWKSATGMVLVLQTAKHQVQEVVDAIEIQRASGTNTVHVELSARLTLIETQLKEINQIVQRDMAFAELLHQMGYLVLPNEPASKVK